MTNKFIFVVFLTIFISGVAHANGCRVRVESTFQSDFPMEGDDLMSYRQEIQDYVYSSKEYSIVPNQITVQERSSVVSGCDVVSYQEPFKSVRRDNPNYDYKIVVSQLLNVKDQQPKYQFAKSEKNEFRVKLVGQYTNISLVSEFYMIDSNGNPIQFRGKFLKGNYSFQDKVIVGKNIEEKLNDAIGHSREAILSHIESLPNCSELEEFKK